MISKFADHDLVLLGETHEVKDNCELVASLVAPLYKAGVRTLCPEFICSRNNKRLAEIIAAKEYDELAVVDLFRSGPWPTWGYKEYMDIVRAIWAFNRGLLPEAEPFRMIGIDADFWSMRRQYRKDCVGSEKESVRRLKSWIAALAARLIRRQKASAPKPH